MNIFNDDKRYSDNDSDIGHQDVLDELQPTGINSVDSFERKARMISKQLCAEQEEIKRVTKEATERLFDSFYSDWPDREIRKHWKEIPFSFQEEYCRRKGIDWVYSWSLEQDKFSK